MRFLLRRLQTISLLLLLEAPSLLLYLLMVLDETRGLLNTASACFIDACCILYFGDMSGYFISLMKSISDAILRVMCSHFWLMVVEESEV